MLSGRGEMLLGLRRDALGWALVVGHGGVRAEIHHDSAIVLLPDDGVISASRILSLLRRLRCWPLLEGFRGAPGADVDALVLAAQRLSRLPSVMGHRLLEAEINPLIVMPPGQGVRTVDGMILLV